MMAIASDASWIARVIVEEGNQAWAGKGKATWSRMEEIHRSIMVYRDSAKCLPGSLKLLEIMLTTGTVPVLRDAWSQKFFYATEGHNYLIISAGSDQRQGTEDDLIMTFVNGVKRKGRMPVERGKLGGMDDSTS